MSNAFIREHATILLIALLFVGFFPGLFASVLAIPKTVIRLLVPGLFSLPPSKAGSQQPSASLSTASTTMTWFQKSLTLPTRSRGSYLITDHIVSSLPEIKSYKVGLLNLFIQHTSCALSLNENWDEEVREDMSDALDRIVPEDTKGKGLYRHNAEGSDDMPAHVKSALIGASVTIPIRDGKLQTGTWQGIWHLEFRQAKHSRKVIATIQGEKS